jgi:DNA invertase Pin-like site-specific DNA recombinase
MAADTNRDMIEGLYNAVHTVARQLHREAAVGSARRQREAVLACAKAHRLEVIQEFYDAAVSGADPIDARTAFAEMIAFCGNGGPKVVLVENAAGLRVI